LALTGWLLDIGALKSVLPGGATMKPNTAACFILSGLSLWLLRAGPGQSNGVNPRRKFMAQVCAGVVALVGLLTLGEYWLKINFGLDELLFRQALVATQIPNPGRMSPATAADFVLLGLALVVLDVEFPRGHRSAQYLALVTVGVGLIALLGYNYSVQALYQIYPYSSMALHTSLLFITLGLGALFARPDRGLMATITSEQGGGLMARRILPLAIGLPLIMGWLRLAGERAGLYKTEFGTALLTAANIVIFATVIWWSARSLNRTDVERRRAAEDLEFANEMLRVEIGERHAAQEALAATNLELESKVAERTIELAEAKERAESSDRLKSDFLASMSHELRTPLNAIIGFTGTLLMKLPGPLTTDQEKQLRTVQSSAKHLLALINDILDVAKIEAGKIELQLEPIACQSVIEEVATALQPAAERKGLKFEVNLPPAEVVVQADRRALSQILINLTNNAIKFTEQGSVCLELSQRRSNGRTLTEISVSDTGVGIRPEDQTKLFKAFIQVSSGIRRRSEGTGLGLHLSQKLAELLGGQITFQSEFGKGSRFSLIL
jgi:signal transduction histidine kinase